MASSEIIDEIIANFSRLPEVSAIALRVNRMLETPDTTAKDLAAVIVQDPAFTTKVLSLCNSAEYGFARKIATISEAVSILGFKELKKIVFTILSRNFLDRPVQGYALEKGALWENAITCAAYAQHLAGRFGFKDPELAFVAALLRDIGKIALESYVSGKSERLEKLAREHKCSFAEAEELLIGANHMDVGSRLASKWNLPESLLKAITYHHRPSDLPADTSPEDRRLVSIIHLADAFAMMAGVGIGADGLMYPLDMAVFGNLNLEPSNAQMEALYTEFLCLNEDRSSPADLLAAPKDK